MRGTHASARGKAVCCIEALIAGVGLMYNKQVKGCVKHPRCHHQRASGKRRLPVEPYAHAVGRGVRFKPAQQTVWAAAYTTHTQKPPEV